MDFGSYIQARVTRIEQFLVEVLPLQTQKTHSAPLYNAIRYSVLNGGKRIRPLLVYATGEALGESLDILDARAAAIELIHCYSLIHDDLPAMDNDDLRRGVPTCHKAFDEATAILAGDALQTLAFQILADGKLNPVTPAQQVQMIHILALKSGMEGMIDGQALDLHAKDNGLTMTLDELHRMHQKKTGALIEAAITLGTLTAQETLTEDKRLKLQHYARCIGLAYQIQDDILDVVGDAVTLGKTAGKDQEQNKTTFATALGISQAKEYAQSLQSQALDALQFLAEKGQRLVQFSELFINRAY